MSGAMELPPTTDGATTSREDASFIWLLLTTPLGELARGRVTGRRIRPLRASPAVAAIPASLQTVVHDVARRTRLWPGEKREIVRELSSHFADGLDAEQSEADLIAQFGDPAQAAALLRRAAKRNRPWPWLALRFAVRGVAIVFAFILLTYAALAARYYLGRAGPIEDLRPKLNAVALTTPDADKAWPLYRDALLAMPADAYVEGLRVAKKYERLPVPGDPEWAEVEAILALNAESMRLAREAAAKPHLGLLVGYTFATDDAKALMMPEQPPAGDIKSPDDPGLISVLLPHLARLRMLGMTLSYDAQRAAAAGDADIALADLQAILGIVGHMRETPLLIGELVGLSLFARACDTVNDILARSPGLFSDAQLIALAHRLAAFDDARLRCRFDGERLFFDDVLQRIYTDDGNGDGRLTPRGLRWLAMAGSIWDAKRPDRVEPDALLGFTGPALSAIVRGRKDTAAEYARLMDINERDADTPLWERNSSEVDAVIAKWLDSPLERMRNLPLSMLVPALGKASINAQMTMMRRDVTLTVIALELFHRTNQRWPASLAELSPQWLPSPPVDRFDGSTLRYRINGDRPMLYSVGTDREDDGGIPPSTGAEYAQQWFPRDWIRETVAHQKPIITGDGRRILYWDGDWTLWPPPAPGPLHLVDPAIDS